MSSYRKAPRDGRCTKYSETGSGRCTNPALEGKILCERCTADRRNWGQRGRIKGRKTAEGELLPVASVALPAWMGDPSLLPKRPPGRKP